MTLFIGPDPEWPSSRPTNRGPQQPTHRGPCVRPPPPPRMRTSPAHVPVSTAQSPDHAPPPLHTAWSLTRPSLPLSFFHSPAPSPTQHKHHPTIATASFPLPPSSAPSHTRPSTPPSYPLLLGTIHPLLSFGKPSRRRNQTRIHAPCFGERQL
jgi:hypothetical protein